MHWSEIYDSMSSAVGPPYENPQSSNNYDLIVKLSQGSMALAEDLWPAATLIIDLGQYGTQCYIGIFKYLGAVLIGH